MPTPGNDMLMISSKDLVAEVNGASLRELSLHGIAKDVGYIPSCHTLPKSQNDQVTMLTATAAPTATHDPLVRVEGPAPRRRGQRLRARHPRAPHGASASVPAQVAGDSGAGPGRGTEPHRCRWCVTVMIPPSQGDPLSRIGDFGARVWDFRIRGCLSAL